MLSNIELDHLNESDIGRCLNDVDGLKGWVRIESRPTRRVVVDFTMKLGAAGRQREQKLGTWPDRSLADIRRTADQLRRAPVTVAIALKQSPKAASTRVAVGEGASMTVSELFDGWHREALGDRKDAGESVRRSLLKDVMPHIGGQVASSITSTEVSAMLKRIVERGAPRQAGCVLADLRQMFRWGLQAGVVDTDPTTTLHKSDFGGAAQERSRTLSEDEVAELAIRMDAGRLAPHVRQAVWLLLATGVRVGELVQARWNDIDLYRRTWTIPAEFSHSGREHTLPLSAFAIRQLEPGIRSKRSDQWVFPGRTPSEALSAKALGKQIRDRQRGTQIRGRSSATQTLLLSGGAWTPLDLRRTTAALMLASGTDPALVAVCLSQSQRPVSTIEDSTVTAFDEWVQVFETLGNRLQSFENRSRADERQAA
jgi:integrase